MVEQPIRNRQVESSTLSLGSNYLVSNQCALQRARAGLGANPLIPLLDSRKSVLWVFAPACINLDFPR